MWFYKTNFYKALSMHKRASKRSRRVYPPVFANKGKTTWSSWDSTHSSVRRRKKKSDSSWINICCYGQQSDVPVPLCSHFQKHWTRSSGNKASFDYCTAYTCSMHNNKYHVRISGNYFETNIHLKSENTSISISRILDNKFYSLT